ncbi:hypothetical protein [Kosakonia sacchari]|uniref:Minor capsid protein n=1 Tax=Kosakonia sacchari TaxID=1158459 RepID=A0ABZ0MWX8_9ENTR|nr:hypothetical protein [Kosakonia sacchari]WOZ79488.1 hypothetical protein Q8Y70_10730 [Kosakonia sacchari]
MAEQIKRYEMRDQGGSKSLYGYIEDDCFISQRGNAVYPITDGTFSIGATSNPVTGDAFIFTVDMGKRIVTRSDGIEFDIVEVIE